MTGIEFVNSTNFIQHTILDTIKNIFTEHETEIDIIELTNLLLDEEE